MTTNTILLTAALLSHITAGTLLAQRKPVTIEPLTELQHEPTGNGNRVDATTGGLTTFALDGRIEHQMTTGNFRLSWIGIDGTRQMVDYEPRDKVSAEIIATATFDERTALYTYSYTVVNSRTSRQAVRSLFIEGGAIERIEAPSSDWMTLNFQDVTKRRFESEGGWSWSLTGGIAPGATATGFRLVSRFPPAPVRSFIAGVNRAMVSGEGMPEELEIAVARSNWRLPRGLTIGPAMQAAPATAAESARMLDAAIVQAGAEGWLGSAAGGARVRNSTSRISDLVAQGDFTQARAEIARALDAAAADSSLLSEGHALLTIGLRNLEEVLRR